MLKIALKFILYDKPKSIGALAGTIISIFLIGQNIGIFIFLTNSMSALVRNNADYIWVVDSKTTNVNSLSLLDTRLGHELESIKGVKKAYPLVVAGGSARFPNGKSAALTLIGSQAPAFAGGPWNVFIGQKGLLLQEGAIFTDFFDSKTLGDVALGDYFEINGKKVFVAGQTRGVRSFGGVYAFTTVERARYLGKVSPYKANAFLIEWNPSIQPDEITARINSGIAGVRAWESKEFTYQTILTVVKSSGIAISFGTIILFALIAGLVIIGLTLYSAAIDRIRDYGTLKAIGATNRYIRRLILTQALVFGLAGFVIGYLFIQGFRVGIANAGTIFSYPWWLQIIFFVLTLLISLGGSLFAIRRVASVEPAQVFR
ncbi:FtsX-like permease family protein [Cytophagaceae bacterium YF14B1]|uniref:FtsX-like permease family protein n=1 Tax=Xanthocytophaga flava TaxID=3048013 RepID=A0AAE3U877_9BACT|nr:FtsX-like permease family protein [Xanthocytophaga flavus]MDJ1483136.1 FtsX-like permease family protein [Xanthocytophaga flavus]